MHIAWINGAPAVLAVIEGRGGGRRGVRVREGKVASLCGMRRRGPAGARLSESWRRTIRRAGHRGVVTRAEQAGRPPRAC
ncbi:hypothetical protein LV779_25005 [Streptomyces thinghirensis]|nr:hypothetical protein [Streptomyces thinghirensis]